MLEKIRSECVYGDIARNRVGQEIRARAVEAKKLYLATFLCATETAALSSVMVALFTLNAMLVLLCCL